MPTIQLLKKYDLMQFAEVTKAVRYDDYFIALCVSSKSSMEKVFMWDEWGRQGRRIATKSDNSFSHLGETLSGFHFFTLTVKAIFSSWMTP